MKKKNKKLDILMILTIIAGVLVFGAAGTLIGLEAGRLHTEVETARAEREAKKASADSGESTAAPESGLSDSNLTESVDPEALAAALRATSDVIRGVAVAAVPNVSEYADAVQNGNLVTPIPRNSLENAGTGENPTAEENPTEGNGFIVCIDAGHETHQITDLEPNGPNSENMKQGVTSGTQGNWSGVYEYQVNLDVTLKLRDALTARGYTVVLCREINDVTMSNVQRAQIATDANADIFLRIHCNSADSSSVDGVLCYAPTSSNPYLSEEVIERSQALSRIMRDAQCEETGQDALDNLYQDDMTGINWATMPVTIVEMGCMSSYDEDMFLTSEDGQDQIVRGLANGVDEYFSQYGRMETAE